jgi:translocation and assembly module TamA
MSAAQAGVAAYPSWLGAWLVALLSATPSSFVWAQTPTTTTTPAAPQAVAPAAPTAVGWTVQVEAPERLRLLLERNLDLVRLQKLGAEQNIGDDELKRLIDATPKQARELLQTEGYFDPQVKIERSVTSADSAPVALSVQVDPGPVTRVHRVRLDFQGELAVALATAESTSTPTAESRRAATALVTSLNKAWPLKAGEAFRNAQWVDGKNALLSQLRSAGYAAASLSGSAADIDASNQRASLVVVVDAGPLFRSGAVDIEGLALHERAAVLNHARFELGTPLTETMLLDFQERLLKSGLFQQAAVTMDTDPEQAAAARLLVRVKELPANQVTTGVGYSSNSGPRVTVEYLGRRLFGLPATLRNKAEWGRKRQAWDAELSSATPAPGPRLGIHAH